jgi:hypothetical protein
MTDFMPWEKLKQQMLIEAVEHYIYRMKEDKCNEAAIEIYTELLEELEQE